MTARELERLRETAEDLKRRSERAEGALAQLLKELKREFGIDSIADADEAIKKMDRDVAELERKRDEAFEAFKKRWGSKLKDGDS